MTKVQQIPRRALLKVTSFCIAALFLLTGSLPANAATSDCITTPPLDQAHKSQEISLGNGVKASSWTWQPGSDARAASLSPLGSKVSVVSGNLRHITFGVLQMGVPKSQDIRALTNSNPRTIASLNGDYFDSKGPWNAMVKDGQVTYSPPGKTGVLGLVRTTLVDSKGYRSTGTLTLGTRKFNITGVNQLEPGPSSLVAYRTNFIRPVTPKGQTTLVLKSGKIYKIYTKGAAVSSKGGTVIQVKGYLAPIIAKYKVKTPVKISLPPMPKFEYRMGMDNLTTVGNISTKTTTLNFGAVNYSNLASSGATLFDSNFVNTTKAGRASIRITPDSTGKFVVKNVYKTGSQLKVDAGGYVVQINGSSASTIASKFKVGEYVNVSRAFQSDSKLRFETAAGRGPRLVQGSKLVWICSLHNKDFRPRSAIGWNQDGQIWFMTSSRGVDAFDFGYRQGGSTSSQMGEWLLSLGATDAVLLDGGGSTTLQIVDPTQGSKRFDLPDISWYRELANAFSIERKN